MVLLTSNFFLQEMYVATYQYQAKKLIYIIVTYMKTMIVFQSRIPHSFSGDLRNHIRSKTQTEKIKWLQVWKVRKIFDESHWFLSLIITKKIITPLLLDFFFDSCNSSLSNSFSSSWSLTFSYSCTSIYRYFHRLVLLLIIVRPWMAI